MARIPLTELVVSIVGETSDILAAFREVEAAKKRVMEGGDSSDLQRALDKLAVASRGARQELEPLTRSSSQITKEMRDLGVAVRNGIVPIAEGARRFRELEAVLKAKLGTLQKGTDEYKQVRRAMQEAGSEAKRLESINRLVMSSYRSEELERYRARLLEIVAAERVSGGSKQEAIAKLRALYGELQKQAAALKDNAGEHRRVAAVMNETGAAIKRLEGEERRLQAAFRGDYLRLYAGELRAIDGEVARIGFEGAARKVEQLSRELREQQNQLAKTGGEYNQLGRILKEAAAQQERYERAAKEAQAANDTSRLRAYATEVKRTEGELISLTKELGRLDAQQRAIRYDTGEVAAYRRESEQLATGLTAISGRLDTLRSNLLSYANSVQRGSSEHTELVRLLAATENATRQVTQSQERLTASYRSAEINQFSARLREIEAAQRSGAMSAEQAARAVNEVEREFREYTSALNVTQRELNAYTTTQRTASQASVQLASAQERAQRAFEARVLQGFRDELERIVKSQREGTATFEQSARAINELQGRMREYGASLQRSGADQTNLNRLLDISSRSLRELGAAAQTSARGFDAQPLERYGRGLESLQASQRQVSQAAELLTQAQLRTQNAFVATQLDRYRSQLEALMRSTREGGRDFEVLARAADQTERELREYLATLNRGSSEHSELRRVLDTTSGAVRQLATDFDRAQRAFDPSGPNRYAREIKALEQSQRDLSRVSDLLTQSQNRTQEAFRNAQVDRFRGELEALSRALVSGSSDFDKLARAAQTTERDLRAYLATLDRNSAEHNELKRVLDTAGAALRNLGVDAERTSRAFVPNEVVRFRAELEQVVRSQREGSASFEQGVQAVTRLNNQMREHAAVLARSGQSQRELNAVLNLGERALVELSSAAERANRPTRELGASLDMAQRSAVQLSPAFDRVERELLELGAAFERADRATAQLSSGQERTQRTLQGTGEAANRAERELLELGAASERAERAANQLASNQERVQRTLQSTSEAANRTERELLELGTASERADRSSGQLAANQERAQRALQGTGEAANRAERELLELGAASDRAERSASQLAANQERTQRALLGTSESANRAERELLELGAASERAERAASQLAANQERTQRALQGTGESASRASRELSALESYQRQLERASLSLAEAQTRTSRAFADSNFDRYRSQLEGLGRAALDGSKDLDTLSREATELERDMRGYLSTLERGSSEHRALGVAVTSASQAVRVLATDAERTSRAFDPQPAQRFSGELREMQATSRDVGSSLDLIERELKELDGALRNTGAAATIGERELRSMGAVQRELESATSRLTQELERNQAAMRAEQMKQFRFELEQIVTSQKNGVVTFDQSARAIEALQGRMREFASSTQLTASEQRTLSAAMQATETAAVQLANAQERANRAFIADQIRQFRFELQTAVAEQRNGILTFEQATAKVNELQSRMREYGATLGDNAQAQRTLETVLNQSQTAITRFAEAAQRAQDKLVAEHITKFDSELLELTTSFEKGGVGLDEFRARIEKMQAGLKEAQGAVERGSAAYLQYAQAADRASTALATAEGRTRLFGVQAGFAAGAGDQLQNMLFRLGPAGEAMGIAMMTASRGLEQASIAARLLNTALAAGLIGAVVGAIVGIVKLIGLARDLDTAQADVAKTTNLTAAELTNLTDRLQQVSLETGTATTELLGIAAVAGQLGIQGVNDIAQFTEVINKLAIATDVVGEEGAANLARFINVTKDANQTVGESANLVGNVLNALGNSLSATEAQILDATRYLGQLKTIAGASQTDILALAGAMQAVGLRAEAGNAAARIFTKLQEATARGGESMKAYADAAGLTEAEWKRLVQSNPVDAFEALAGGMAKTLAEGKSLLPVLDSLGIKGSIERDVLLRLVGGYETLSQARRTASDEARELNSLSDETAARLNTIQGQAELAGAKFRVFGENLAQWAAPAIRDFLIGVNSLLDGINNLFDNMQRGERPINTVTTAFRESKGEITQAEMAVNQAGVAFGWLGNVLMQGLTGMTASQRELASLQRAMQDAGQQATFTADEFIKMATGTGDFNAIFQEMVRRLDGDGQRAMEAFARSTLGPILAQGDLQQATVETIAEMARLEAAALRAQIATDNSISERLRDQISQLSARLVELNEEYERIPSVTEAARDGYLVSGEEIAVNTVKAMRNREEHERLTAQLNAAQGSLSELQERSRRAGEQLDQLERTTSVLNDTTLTSDERYQKLLETWRIADNTAAGLTDSQYALANAQEEYINLSSKSREQAEEYLAQLYRMRELYPDVADQLDSLISGVEQYISTLPAASDETDSHANSLSALRERRKELVDAYNSAEIGSAAQREALQAIQAIDQQIAASDQLSNTVKTLSSEYQIFADRMRTEVVRGLTEPGEAANRLAFELQELRNKKDALLASGFYNDADLRALDADIRAVEQALYAVDPAADTAFRSLAVNVTATVDPLNSLSVAQGNVNEALRVAREEYRATGDAQAFAEAQVRAYEGALATLRTAGVDPLSSAYKAFEADLRAAQGALEAFSSETRLTLTSVTGLEGVMRELRTANAEAAREFSYTGDQVAYLEQRIANNEAALRSLRDKGYGELHPEVVRLREENERLATVELGLAQATQTFNAALSDSLAVFRNTGDAQKFAADQVKAHQEALDTLRKAGVDPLHPAFVQHQRDLELAQLAMRQFGETSSGAIYSVSGMEQVLRELALANGEASREFRLTGDEVTYLQTQLKNNEEALRSLRANGYGELHPEVVRLREESERLRTETIPLAEAQAKLSEALQQAENRYTVTGDAQQYAADRAAAYSAALQALTDAGIDPARVGLESWVAELGSAQRELDAQVQATERAAVASKLYEGAVTSLNDAQRAFQDGISQSDIPKLISELEQAAAESDRAASAFTQLGAGYEEAARLSRETSEAIRDQIERLRELKLVYEGLGALSQVAESLAKAFDTTDMQSQLDALRQKRDELLQSGEYDPRALQQMNADIVALEQSIGDAKRWESAFKAISDGADAAFEAIQRGASDAQVAFAAIGSGLQHLTSIFGESNTVVEAWAQGATNAITSLAQGNVIGFVGGILQGVIGMFRAHSDEVAQYNTIVAQHGEEIAQRFTEMTATGIQVNEQAYNDWVAAEKRRAEEHKRFLDEWAERERERNERIREAQQELAQITRDAQQSLNDIRRDVAETRLEFARSQGADEGLVFISETILKVRDQSREFGAEMQRITDEKNEYIRQYLAANPGATRGEAEAAAEAVFGPQREAIREQFALTSATILTEAAQQAEKLGMSQREFYEAVFRGNTELLGNMTEGQRQAIIQIVELMREMGIQLPAAIDEAYAAAQESWRAAGEANVQAQREAAQAQLDAMREEKEAYKAAFEERKAYLEQQIASSTGATQEMYRGMLQAETEAYRQGLAERNAAITEAERGATQQTVSEMQAEREKLRTSYEAEVQRLDEAIANSTGSTREALIREKEELSNSFREKDQALADAIREGSDGVGSALESNAQATLSMIQNDIAATNEAWAKRSAELQHLINTTSGDVQQAYIRMYEAERATYERESKMLQDQLVQANQALLDAQDKSTAEWVAAQEQAGRQMQESLNGVYAILRQVLGEDAQLIIDMIQRTYNAQREAHIAGGVAAREGVEQANRSQIEQLNSVYAILRQILGEDANVIISMIQNTYEARARAHQTGGEAAARAAEASAQTERQSVANINQMLRDLFGPEAQGIIDQILALYRRREEAYRQGGAQAAAGAEAGATSERQAVANINQLLRDLFGPEAQGIIDQILALYNKRAQAHREGGQQAAQAQNEATQVETQAVNQHGQQVSGAVESSAQQTAGAVDGATATETQAIDRHGEQVAGAAETSGAKSATALGGMFTRLGDIVRMGGGEVSTATMTSIGDIVRTWDSQGNVLTSQVTGRAQLIGGGISSAYGTLQSAVQSGSAQFVGTVVSATQQEDARYRETSAMLISRIMQAKGDERARLVAEYEQLQREHASKSDAHRDAIRRLAEAEESQHQQAANALMARITQAKGDEREKLIAEYEAMKREHDAKSRDYRDTISKAAEDEASGLDGAATVVGRGMSGMGSDVASAGEAAYAAIMRLHAFKSRLYQGLIRDAAIDEAKRVALAAGSVSGQYGTSASSLETAIGSYYKRQQDKHESAGKTLMERIGDIASKIGERLRSAASAIAKGVGNLLGIGGYSAFEPSVSLGDTVSTFYDDASSAVGVFAAATLPDYSSATRQMRAYAASTRSLVNLFDSSNRLTLNATQERALTLNVSFASLASAFSAPLALLERFVSSLWEVARYERETALYNRQTAELLRRNLTREATHPSVQHVRRRR